MAKKLTRKEQDAITYAANLKYFQENGFHENNVGQPLYDTVEFIEDRLTNYGAMKFSHINPTPAAVEIIGAMQRALTELQALEQKYFPDPVEDEDEQQAA